MSVSRVKTWGVEVLTHSDLNTEFNNILTNGEDLGWPATKAKDLDGNELVLDSNGDTSITADTDDQIDVKIGGTDVFVLTSTGMKINGKPVLTSADRKSADEALVRVRTLEARLASLEAAAETAAQISNF